MVLDLSRGFLSQHTPCGFHKGRTVRFVAIRSFSKTLSTFRSRYFFSIVGSSVKIHASSTGHVVSTLSVTTLGGSSLRSDGGHTAKITSALLNPHNPFQLITASLDGYIKFWDYLDGTVLQTIRLPQPIFMIAAHDKVKGYIFAIT